MSTLVIGTAEQGLMYAIMVLGVYLSFRVLNYADLSVEGSFTLGAATTATLIVGGTNPWSATAVAFVAGILAGLFTGILHTRFKITPLLSGILTMTALYSINLRIMGKANVSLLRSETIFTDFQALPLSFMPKFGTLILCFFAVVLIATILYRFLQTEIGLALRATGDNEVMISSLGVNIDHTKILGLALSNGLVALSGSFVAQSAKFADAQMGIGMIVAGLASLIIGEVLVGTSTVLRAIVAAICGGILYRVIIAIVLQLGLGATDLKLFTAILVIIAMVSPQVRAKLLARSNRAQGKEAPHADHS